MNTYWYSRGILSAIDPKSDSPEKDESRRRAQEGGRPLRSEFSFFAPTSSLKPEMTGLNTKTNAAGNYFVSTPVVDLFDAFRPQSRLIQLGASFLRGLKYSAMLTVQDGTPSAYWVSEDPGSDVAESSPSFRGVLATPKTLQCTLAVSHQLVQQAASNLDLEQRLRLQIANKLADAFDAAAICGSGTNGSPLGLLGIPGIGTTAIAANGGPATYDTILAMEEAVANGNAPDGIAWLSTPNVRKLLRKTFINSTGSEPVWEGDQVLGHPALVSTNVPSTLSKGTTSGSLHAIVCGAFSEIILCEFGSLEILVDRYRLKKQGAFELTAFWMVDVVVPRPAAFNVCIDAALS